MSYDWTKFRDLADWLRQCSVSPVDEETRCRCAISRSYYAAFCHARDELPGKQVAGAAVAFASKAIDHKLVPTELRRFIGGAMAAAQLELLRRRRNAADYDAQHAPANWVALAQSCLALADNVITFVDSLP